MNDCKKCRFFQEINNDVGECRKDPPKIYIVPTRTVAGEGMAAQPMFPQVAPGCWCGGFDVGKPGNLVAH